MPVNWLNLPKHYHALCVSIGWGLEYEEVWRGFVLGITWFIVFLFIAGIGLRIRKWQTFYIYLWGSFLLFIAEIRRVIFTKGCKQKLLFSRWVQNSCFIHWCAQLRAIKFVIGSFISIYKIYIRWQYINEGGCRDVTSRSCLHRDGRLFISPILYIFV